MTQQDLADKIGATPDHKTFTLLIHKHKQTTVIS